MNFTNQDSKNHYRKITFLENVVLYSCNQTSNSYQSDIIYETSLVSDFQRDQTSWLLSNSTCVAWLPIEQQSNVCYRVFQLMLFVQPQRETRWLVFLNERKYQYMMSIYLVFVDSKILWWNLLSKGEECSAFRVR